MDSSSPHPWQTVNDKQEDLNLEIDTGLREHKKMFWKRSSKYAIGIGVLSLLVLGILFTQSLSSQNLFLADVLTGGNAPDNSTEEILNNIFPSNDLDTSTDNGVVDNTGSEIAVIDESSPKSGEVDINSFFTADILGNETSSVVTEAIEVTGLEPITDIPPLDEEPLSGTGLISTATGGDIGTENDGNNDIFAFLEDNNDKPFEFINNGSDTTATIETKVVDQSPTFDKFAPTTEISGSPFPVNPYALSAQNSQVPVTNNVIYHTPDSYPDSMTPAQDRGVTTVPETGPATYILLVVSLLVGWLWLRLKKLKYIS